MKPQKTEIDHHADGSQTIWVPAPPPQRAWVNGPEGGERVTWQNPLQHREFSPSKDFTGMWHGVEYLRGGRVCPGPFLREMPHSKLQGDE